MWREALVSHQLEIDLFIRLSGPLLNCAFNCIAINRGLSRFLHGGGQSRVQIGVRSAQLGRDHELADELGRHLPFLLRVCFAPRLFPLCAHSAAFWETWRSASIQITRGRSGGVHLATATGTPDSSGSNLRMAHTCRMNAAFRLGARCNLVAVTRCAHNRLN